MISKFNFDKYEMAQTYITIDRALEFVGDNLWYQKRVLFIAVVNWILFSFIIMGNPFYYQSPKFKCLVQLQNNTQIFQECSWQNYCENQEQNQIYNPNNVNSVTTSFHLYCGRQNFISMAGSFFFFGATISIFVFPVLSDIIGRKRAQILANLTFAIFISLSSASFHIYMYIISLTIIGFSFNGFEIVNFVYIAEVSTSRFRNWAIVILQLAWAIGNMILSIFTNLIHNWRILILTVIGIPFFFIVILQIKFYKESPRFLVSQKQYQLAKKILDYISQCNKRPRFQYRLVGEEQEFCEKDQKDIEKYQKESNLLFYQCSQDDDNNYFKQQSKLKPKSFFEMNKFNFLKYSDSSQIKNINFHQIWKNAYLKRLIIKMGILWFFRFFVYFGFAFSISSFGSGEFQIKETFLVLSSIELVGCILSGFIRNIFLKRLLFLKITVLIIIVISFTLLWLKIPEECLGQQDKQCLQNIISIALASISKLAITIYSGMLLIYTMEVFPTSIRSLGFGFCISIGKFGTIAVPFITSYFFKQNINPLIIFGFIGIIVEFIIYLLPETYGQVLSEDIFENQMNSNSSQLNKYNKNKLQKKDLSAQQLLKQKLLPSQIQKDDQNHFHSQLKQQELELIPFSNNTSQN